MFKCSYRNKYLTPCYFLAVDIIVLQLEIDATYAAVVFYFLIININLDKTFRVIPSYTSAYREKFFRLRYPVDEEKEYRNTHDNK